MAQVIRTQKEHGMARQKVTDDQRIEAFFAQADGPSALGMYANIRGILIGRGLVAIGGLPERKTRTDAGQKRKGRNGSPTLPLEATE
jgi:hypothetical protein